MLLLDSHGAVRAAPTWPPEVPTGAPVWTDGKAVLLSLASDRPFKASSAFTSAAFRTTGSAMSCRARRLTLWCCSRLARSLMRAASHAGMPPAQEIRVSSWQVLAHL